MSELTTHYSLIKPELTDLVNVTIDPDIPDSYDIIDAQLWIAAQHIASTGAHNAEWIPYAGSVSGAANVEQALDDLQNQISSITVGAGTSPAEVVAARDGVRGETFATLNDRIDVIEKMLGNTTNISTTTILTNAYRGTILVDTTGGDVTLTLPTNGVSSSIQVFNIKKVAGNNAVIIVANGTNSVDGYQNRILTDINDSVFLIADGLDVYDVISKNNKDLNFINIMNITSSKIYNGAINCGPDITEAISLLPTSGGTIYFPSTELGGNYYLDSNITLPDNCTLKFDDGAKITVNSSKAITGTKTKIDAGLTQIFDAVGTTPVNGTWNLKECYPEWFGAIGDNLTDDTDAFSNMLTFNSTSNNYVNLTKTYKVDTVSISKIVTHDWASGTTAWTLSGSEALADILIVTGTPGAAIIIVNIPVYNGRKYTVKNETNRTFTFKVSGQTGVIVPSNKSTFIIGNSTDYYEPKPTNNTSTYSGLIGHITTSILAGATSTVTIQISTVYNLIGGLGIIGNTSDNLGAIIIFNATDTDAACVSQENADYGIYNNYGVNSTLTSTILGENYIRLIKAYVDAGNIKLVFENTDGSNPRSCNFYMTYQVWY